VSGKLRLSEGNLSFQLLNNSHQNANHLTLIQDNKQQKYVTTAYRIECVTVAKDELNVGDKLLNDLVVVEVCSVQTTSNSPEVHRSCNNFVVVWNLMHTALHHS